MTKPGTVKSGLDIKRILIKYAKNWYLFLIAIILAYMYASYKNRYIIPVYSMSTTVLIEDISNASVLEERGQISSSPLFLSSQLVENQISFIKSFGQIKRIIKQLDFDVSYFAKEKYNWIEIYKKTPFIVKFDTTHKQIRYKQLNVKFTSGSEFQLYSDELPVFKIPQKHKVGDTISSKDYKFCLLLNYDSEIENFVNKEYGFSINDVDGLTGQYRNKTNIYIDGKTSVLNITSSGPNKQKEKDYLNKLTEYFLLTNLEKKNKILTNTINFINSQLIQIGRDLDSAEQRLENFRRKNNFMELSQKAAALLNEINSQNKTRNGLVLDLKYYEYLLDYLMTRDRFDDIVMPSTVGLSLPLFSDLVLKLSTTILEKEDLIANSSRNNPYIATLEEQIQNMKIALITNMKSIIETTHIKINDIDYRLVLSNAEFQGLPSIEREFLEIQRQYKIFNDLYDLLLKRKSEVEIKRAANMPDHEIIDLAGDTGIKVISPSPNSAYVNAMIWAILIPAILLFFVVFLNNRVMALEDITLNSEIPVIGSLMRTPYKNNSDVLRSPNTYFVEMLRIIRIKLNLEPTKGQQVVEITSSMTDEGKTFFAINFASVYALTGKKTLLLGYDLRQPSIADEFNINPYIGITNYMISDMDVDQIIQKTFTKNLDILVSGPIPPNPDEMIESEKTASLFKELRKKYDYIIMDTSPIGLVGDGYLLNKYADATLFVVRYNFSTKRLFSVTVQEAADNQMKNLFIVYNDVKIKASESELSFYGEKQPEKFLVIRWFVKIRKGMIGFLRKL